MAKTFNECTGYKDCPDYTKLNKVCMAYEKELKALLTEKEFANLSIRIAKELIKDDIKDMKDSDFKTFLKEHFHDTFGEDISNL